MKSLFENRSADPPPGPGPGPDKRWRIIFIGDHGRVITLKHIKTILVLALAFFILAAAALAVLFVDNRRGHGRTRELRQRLETAEQKVHTLLHEKDLLTAQNVLVEAKMKEAFRGMGRQVYEKRTAGPAGVAPPAAKSPDAASQAAGAADLPGREAEAPAGSAAALAEEGVSAAGLRVRHRRRAQVLEVQLTVTNGNPGRRTVKGTAVAVLKSDELDPDKWLALPRIPLMDGRPTGQPKGHAFEIRQSKVLALTAAADKPLPAYSAAIIYLFDGDGRPIYVREFAVGIQASDD
jgi:hypothetical protein